MTPVGQATVGHATPPLARSITPVGQATITPPVTRSATPAARPFGNAGLAVLSGTPGSTPRKEDLKVNPREGDAMRATVVKGATPSPPGSPEGGRLSETLWAKNERKALRDGNQPAAGRPPLQRPPGNPALYPVPSSASKLLGADETISRPSAPLQRGTTCESAGTRCDSREGARAQEMARAEAKVKKHACMEDLISFLEMHGLPGAYALAFAGEGVEDLTQLLALPEHKLDDLLKKADLDAMDEILLRGALRSKALPEQNNFGTTTQQALGQRDLQVHARLPTPTGGPNAQQPSLGQSRVVERLGSLKVSAADNAYAMRNTVRGGG